MAYGRKRTYRKKRTMSARRTTPFKRVNTRALVAKAKTKELVKLIKGVTLKQAETCYRSVSRPISSLYHDSLAAIPIWSSTDTTIFPPQGNSDGDRRGDEILVQGIRMRMTMQIPWDRRNLTVKMWYVPMNSQQGNPTQYSNFYHNVSGNSQLDPVQTDHWKGIRYLGKYRCRSVDQAAIEGSDKTIMINKWLPLKKKVCFINDGSTIPGNLKEEAFIILAPYDTYNSLVTDIIITNIETVFTLYYKDP